VQANFVFGLDGDEGKEPFELTKEFVNRSPGAFPATRSSPRSAAPHR
jgi:hypothetical protein